jgi:hypothetical protein
VECEEAGVSGDAEDDCADVMIRDGGAKYTSMADESPQS